MSDWSKATRPIPVPDEWTKPFWDAAKRGVLELQRCQSCGHFQHPPYATCVNCMAIDLKFEPVGGAGVIYAYTIMYHTGDQRFAAFDFSQEARYAPDLSPDGVEIGCEGEFHDAIAKRSERRDGGPRRLETR